MDEGERAPFFRPWQSGIHRPELPGAATLCAATVFSAERMQGGCLGGWGLGRGFGRVLGGGFWGRGLMCAIREGESGCVVFSEVD